MERRERARAEREWDRDKVREFGKPGEEKEGGPRRSRSRERRRKERGKSKEKKTEKKGKSCFYVRPFRDNYDLLVSLNRVNHVF